MRLLGSGIHYHLGSLERLYVHIVENYVDAFEFNVSKTYLRGRRLACFSYLEEEARKQGRRSSELALSKRLVLCLAPPPKVLSRSLHRFLQLSQPLRSRCQKLWTGRTSFVVQIYSIFRRIKSGLTKLLECRDFVFRITSCRNAVTRIHPTLPSTTSILDRIRSTKWFCKAQRSKLIIESLEK